MAIQRLARDADAEDKPITMLGYGDVKLLRADGESERLDFALRQHNLLDAAVIVGRFANFNSRLPLYKIPNDRTQLLEDLVEASADVHLCAEFIEVVCHSFLCLLPSTTCSTPLPLMP